MSRFKYTKPTLAIAIASITVSFLYVPSVRAELVADSSTILQVIATNTGNIASYTQDLPTFMKGLAQMATSWMKPDSSDSTAGFVGSFSNLVTGFTTSQTAQTTMLNRLMQDYFQGVSQTTESYANDLDFGTVLGNPLWSPDPRQDPSIDPVYNYIKNASGLTITHVIPNNSWRGNQSDKMTYQQYFQTVSAAQTLNAYLLSQVATDISAGLSTAQQALLKQASDPSWFLAIASGDDLGVVFRQLLLFSSQSYILQLQLLQTEQRLLAAQTLTNTLAISGGLTNEAFLMTKAVKPPPGLS